MKVKELLAKFAPYCYFHPEETSYPIAYETLLYNSQLIVKSGAQNAILPEAYKEKLNDLTPEEILAQWIEEDELQRKSYENGELSLQVDTAKEGMQGDIDLDTNTLKSLPTHCQAALVSLINSDGESELYYRLTYVFIYRDNYPPHAFGLGNHLGDIEHLTLYIRQREDGCCDETIDKAYYAAHNPYEGQWVTANDINTRLGHPVTYIARGSHADYSGLDNSIQFFSSTHYVPRILLFGNDQLSNTGLKYQITEDDINPMPHPIRADYNMNLGDKVSLGKSYVCGEESPYQTNKCVRQIPKKLSLGPLTFWNPKAHADKLSHQENVLKMYELEDELAKNDSDLNDRISNDMTLIY